MITPNHPTKTPDQPGQRAAPKRPKKGSPEPTAKRTKRCAFVVGEGDCADHVVDVFTDHGYHVERSICLCGAFDRLADPAVELIVFTIDQPWLGITSGHGLSMTFSLLRKTHGLVAVATNEHPEIEPSYLEAGVDLVVPFEQVDSPVFLARLAVIARRIRSGLVKR